MAGSDEQHDEQPPAAGVDALRDAVERTFRDAAGALQKLATPQGSDADALAELTARVDALSLRIDKLEAKSKQKPKPKKPSA